MNPPRIISKLRRPSWIETFPPSEKATIEIERDLSGRLT
jgi:hypothetical protein